MYFLQDETSPGCRSNPAISFLGFSSPGGSAYPTTAGNQFATWGSLGCTQQCSDLFCWGHWKLPQGPVWLEFEGVARCQAEPRTGHSCSVPEASVHLIPCPEFPPFSSL